ncbi:MAG: MotA/TolQ/ExbB proton channel family protein [Betaproteobacteria bacterium]|jgi:biopolymer transport protein ExbB
MLNSGIRTSKTYSLGLSILFASVAALAQTAEPAAQAASAAVAAVATSNPYGLEALWATSDVVTKTVLMMLLIMSIGSWYIMVVKVLEQSKMGKQAEEAQAFWGAKTVAEGTQALAEDSPYRFMADAANNAVKKHEGLMGHIPVNDWVSMGLQRAVDRIQGNTQGGLAFLATVGSTSPFVGLFGTVWGIYHALTAIGISGQASIDKVAGPVGEALIMTAIGLAVAVPAVLAYNWLVRRNKAVMDQVRAFSSDLHAVVLGTIKG